MTRGKKLLAMMIALVFVAAATVAALKLTNESVETEQTEISTNVLTVDTGTVTSISWTYNSEYLMFEKQEDGWVYGEDSSFPLNENYVEAALETLSSISSYKTISDYEELSQFGLDEPLCTISVHTDESIVAEDEHATSIVIGDETAIGGQRYISIGDGNVYIADESILDNFEHTLYDMIQMETIPDMTDITSVSVKSQTNNWEIAYMENSPHTYTDQYTWFWKEGESYNALSTSLVDTITSAIEGFGWYECANYNADAASLAQYGLENPAAIVTVNYTQSEQTATDKTDEDGNTVYEDVDTPYTFVLQIGSTEGDYCYAKLQDSNMVYLIYNATAQTLTSADYESYKATDVMLLDWDSLTDFEVYYGEDSYTVTKSTQQTTDDEGNIIEQIVYMLEDGETDAQNLVSHFGYLVSSGDGASAQKGELKLRFVFNTTSETYPQTELIIYSYTDEYCISSVNGTNCQLVHSDAIDSIVKIIEEYKK